MEPALIMCAEHFRHIPTSLCFKLWDAYQIGCEVEPELVPDFAKALALAVQHIRSVIAPAATVPRFNQSWLRKCEIAAALGVREATVTQILFTHFPNAPFESVRGPNPESRVRTKMYSRETAEKIAAIVIARAEARAKSTLSRPLPERATGQPPKSAGPAQKRETAAVG